MCASLAITIMKVPVLHAPTPLFGTDGIAKEIMMVV